MNDYRIFQAQILAKDPSTPRQYSVVEIPNGQKLVGVQLGNALKDQSAPLLGSIVLVLQLDAYRSYILMVLREPYSFLSTNNQYRGFIPSTGNASQDIAIGANPIQDGEIFMEATGPTSPVGQSTPGFGAHLYLGNNGVAQIESGSMGERLIVGGEGTSDDHEVILSADNGYFESNTGSDNIQSTFNYTTNATTGLAEGLQVATQISTPTGITSIDIPICQLTMDTIGNVVLENTALGTGVSLASLKMDPLGDISLKGTTVSLNGGIGQGVARLNDLVLSSLATDPQAFWTFWQTLSTQIAAIPTVPLDGGAALKAGLVALFSTIPLTLTSHISTASITVTAGN